MANSFQEHWSSCQRRKQNRHENCLSRAKKRLCGSAFCFRITSLWQLGEFFIKNVVGHETDTDRTSCRASNGKLHLVPEIGKIPLTHATLDEEPGESSEEEESSAASVSSQSLPISTPSSAAGSVTVSEASLNIVNRDFKIYFDTSTSSQRGKVGVWFISK